MIEHYLNFISQHKIAAAALVVQLVINPISDYLGLRPDKDELVGWVQRYKELPKLLKGSIDGTLLAMNSLIIEWYIQTFAIPRFTGGFVSVLSGLVMIFVGGGLGVSMGKALTERDYSWFNE